MAEIARFTPTERREYEESRKEYWDYYSTMQTAHKKGKAEGLEQGRAEGHLEDARRMKADNMPVELIAKYTGLSISEVMEL
jgi:predicted transposase/invertase (TIGR01784 family)